MKLLITGGAGFIGSNFIHYWLEKHPKDEIINLDKLTYAGNLENLKGLEDNPNYEFVKGDIASPDLVDHLLEGIDTVVNFAAETHVDRSVGDPSIFIQTNVVGTQVLLEAARKAKVKRFHHISTDEVFGMLDLEDGEKFHEGTTYNPRSPYASSKAAADLLARAYYHTFGLPVTITNTSNNFGPYQHIEKLIPRFVTNALADQPLPLYGDGKHVRDWLHVLDHCCAVEIILEEGKPGETYLVGANAEKQNVEIARKILEVLGKSEDLIQFVKDRPGHDRRYALDSTKIRKESGWEPQYDFEEWMERTVHWYKENEGWWRPQKEEAESLYQRLGYGAV